MKITLAVVCAAALGVTACSSGGGEAADPSPSDRNSSVSASPTEAALRQVAKQEFDTYVAGQYGQTWDLWSSDAKRLISRADYEKLHDQCKDAAAGIPILIQAVTITGDTASVRVSRLGYLTAYTFRVDNGVWRFVPAPADQADYRLGVDALIAKDRASGRCAV